MSPNKQRQFSSSLASGQIGQYVEVKGYGFFDVTQKEFIISRPDTPRPWVNYITNGRYAGLISNTAGGYSFYQSPRDSRITRWRYNSLPQDRPGRYIYLKDMDTGQYWSPTWQPVARTLDYYRCRHGFNYTIIEAEFEQIRSQITYFVPLTDDLEIWWVKIKNQGHQKRSLMIFSFVELCLGHALVDLINQPNDQHFNEVWFDKESQTLFATKRYWVTYTAVTVQQANRAWDRWAFMATSLNVEGFDGSKDRFIGPWRSEENPLAVEDGVSFNSEITSGDAIAALRSRVTLNPGEEIEFPILLGVAEKTPNFEKEAAGIVTRYRSMPEVKRSFQAVREDRDDYLSSLQIEVPDKEMGLMVNFWNQYQTKITFLFGRDASYYHGGLLFGRGYRDSGQDSLGPLLTRPEWVKRRITDMAAKQFQDGSAYHCYYPLTGGGERTGHSDTSLWLPFALCQYLKETGEIKFLQQEVEFAEGGKASLLEHVFRAVDLVLKNLSARNLALFKRGDWNDTLDYCGREGKGESVWLSMFLCYILTELVELLEYIKHSKAAYYKKWYYRIKHAINTYCWDGEYYIRGTNDIGELIGSSRNEEGRIFLNAQSWAIISGVAQGERTKKCLAAVRKYLATPKGPKILQPPYTRINDHIGLATRCVPGKKENGAVFNHAVAWAIQAELMAGNGDRAYEYYRQALPMNPVIDIERYEVEPYVYAEYVTSPDHPAFGQASHSWLTGSAVCMLRAVTDYLIGLRPTFDGLLIDPCLPNKFQELRATRKFRHAIYNITISNPEGVNKGIKKILIGGQPADTSLLPAFSDNKEHQIEVIMGSNTI